MIEFTLWDIARNLLLASRWTILLSLIAFIGGASVGLLIMLMRISARRGVRTFAKGYIALFQGTPLLMQLFLIFFGLPMLGFRIEPWGAAVLCLTLFASAYLSEIWRSGVDAIGQGQWDAGGSLGLNYVQRLRLVILPQAMAITRAPTVGFLVQLIKSTALTSIIGFDELLKTSNAINNATFDPLTVYSFVALIFFALCYPLTRYARLLEQRDERIG